MSTQTKLSLESFLAQAIDALPDIPTRAMLPAGQHVIQVVEVKQDELGKDDKEALIFKCKHVETTALVNPSDTPLKAGEEIEFVFFSDNAIGLGKLKEFLQPLSAPGMLLSDLLPAMAGQQFVVTTKVREWKDNSSGEKRQGHEPVGGLSALGG